MTEGTETLFIVTDPQTLHVVGQTSLIHGSQLYELILSYCRGIK
jgi:hypothetical protein